MPGLTRRTKTIDGWRFVRVSASYIDVFPPGSRQPVDCIGVFDYGKDEPRAVTQAEFAAECSEWMDDNRLHLADYASLGG